jgi:CBS domain-containing membrane protein
VTAPASSRTRDALTAFFGAGIAIGALGVLAWTTSRPFLFPSLGATAYLGFSTPRSPAAKWQNVLIGHAVGLLTGLLGLLLFDLRMHVGALMEGVGPERMIAASLAVGLTAGVLVGIGRPHPPAGATSLIVALGLLRTTQDLVTLGLAVGALTVILEVLRYSVDYLRQPTTS